MQKDKIIEELVQTGSEISGSISGAVIGTIIAGPVGLIIGGASGPLISRMFKEIGLELKRRYISPREEVRLGAVFAFTIHKLQEYQKLGIPIRQDQFFTPNDHKRANSAEVLEGLLLTAQKEYEERKLKYLGNLFANICINQNITLEHAHQMIKASSNLSYRQFCFLELLNENRKNQNHNSDTNPYGESKVDISDVIIELRDLQQKGLLRISARIKGYDDNSSPILLQDLKITRSGSLFCDLLELNDLPPDDLESFNKMAKIKIIP